MANDRDSREPELTVKGESIESVYRQYQAGRYWVNRRYQRKLIWTIEEKRKFIDSIINGFPVPIILLAENTTRGDSALEIIDGMQRLNALMSYIRNDYDIEGRYFDLNTMAETKQLLDVGDLMQKAPVLDRSLCVRIASYSLPVSVFEFTKEEAVDEVFRRINSGGRKLSRQELRAAGSLGRFATVVRKLAADIRGDASFSDSLRLNDMATVSITNKDLNYGIPVEDIFWVRHNILTKEQVRESMDEVILSDLISYMVVAEPPSSRSEFLDDYFGITDDEASLRRYNEVETAIQKRSVELVIHDFEVVIDEIKLILAESGQTFGQLLFETKPARAPRYFQVVFLALYTLLVRDGLAVSNRKLLVQRLKNQSETIPIPEGGRWGGEERHNAVQGAAGVYREAFEKATSGDPATIHWITRIENLLSQSMTEQSAFDFKQGFLKLDGSNSWDDGSFEKILRTCVGMANLRRGAKGYVICGVSDKQATTNKISELFGVEARKVLNFWITGVGHEAALLDKDQDQLFQMVVDKVSTSKISTPLREYIARNIKPIRYFEKIIYVFESEGQADVSTYASEFYDRRGAQLRLVAGEDIAPFVKRYVLGS